MMMMMMMMMSTSPAPENAEDFMEYFTLKVPVTITFRNTCIYGKCPKILYPQISDKMTYANSADPDQTAPLGAV